MKLIELYNLKLHEYKSYGVKERPHKLLAMLLLSEIANYQPLRNSQGEFYKKYKNEIDKKISKVEKDFNLTYEEIVEIIEKTVICDNFEEQRIWFVFAEGFGALNWGLLYHEEMTPEEIYSHYFDTDDLKKYYDIEQKAIANNVVITELDDILSKLIDNPTDFYEKVCERLTAEERMFILRTLENKSCLTCLNGSCRVETCDKIGLDEFGKPEGHSCAGWYNAKLIGKAKVLRKININTLN